ncbi:hypothetical protein Aasi_1328 [Candidatus Amoebophilus asiaticus 5a2]|uniref:Uncharacterized protein n=1 Tax=Amoebophilus asiaticus (strain 5a2) TaxID=452471 RepID=B3ETT6_AMOA5|nr:hypothetical protein [Candidatus Amoebophilus asiaticus]ACE06638.1 hypothetical protein Aasi_1328 [Candidatus Amoebophilus asiaticus 5a2]
MWAIGFVVACISFKIKIKKNQFLSSMWSLNKTKKSLILSQLLSLLVIFSIASCDGQCGGKPHAYGDLVMSIDKKELVGNGDKEFEVTFSKEDAKLYGLLEQFELKVEAIQGKVSYSAYENDESTTRTVSNLTENLTRFFNFSEIDAEGGTNEKGNIKFTIVPDEGRVQTRVKITLFKINGENRELKGTPFEVIWNKAESEIGVEFGTFEGLINNNQFQGIQGVKFTISNNADEEISAEDIFIKIISKDGDQHGASFTLSGREVDEVGKNLIQILLLPGFDKVGKNIAPVLITLAVDKENGRDTSAVTLELVCGKKTIKKDLVWYKKAPQSEEERKKEEEKKQEEEKEASKKLELAKAVQKKAQEEADKVFKKLKDKKLTLGNTTAPNLEKRTKAVKDVLIEQIHIPADKVNDELIEKIIELYNKDKNLTEPIYEQTIINRSGRRILGQVVEKLIEARGKNEAIQKELDETKKDYAAKLQVLQQATEETKVVQKKLEDTKKQ